MSKVKPYIKILFVIVLIFTFWYFSMFRECNKRNIKNILGLLSLRNNFDSAVIYLDKNNESKLNDELISITINSNKISELNIKLYNEKHHLLRTINYNDCIIKKNSTCTYLIEEYNVNKIKVDKYNKKKIKINDKTAIKNVKKHIFVNFLISCFITILLILIVKISNKYSIDNKIRRKFEKININKSFVIFASIIGFVTSILIPLYQVPDEQTHINMIYAERNLNTKFQDVITSDTGAEGVLTNSNREIEISKYFDLTNKVNVKKSISIPKKTIIRHFPQSIGMLIGELLHLPVFAYITVCELFALAFYIFICNIALKKMPIKKDLMMFVMLLPVAIQQMASFSYDVVLNSFSFLFIACILELKHHNKLIKNKDILKLFLLLIVIAICKIPYIILFLLMFTLPIKNIKLSFFGKEITHDKLKKIFNRHKYIYISLSVLLVTFSLLICIYFLCRIDIGKVFIASTINIKNTLGLYVKTLRIFFPYYLDTISGNLGWFDTKFPILFQIYVYVSLLIMSFVGEGSKQKFKKIINRKDAIIFYATSLIMIYIIILSMFEWTLMCSNIPNYDKLSIKEYANYIKIIPYIGGVQGRYFIPVLPLILLPINSKRVNNFVNKLSPLLYQLIYYFSLFVILIVILLKRYWI